MKKIILTFCFLALLPQAAFAKAKKEASGLSYNDLKPTQKLIYLGNLLMSGRQQEAFSLILEGGKLKLDDKSKERFQFIQAYTALMQGNAEQASQIFSSLQGKYKEMDPILPYWQARALRLSGKANEALKSLDQLCSGPCNSASPVSARVLREYASSLCAAGEGAKAESLFSELISSQKRELDREYSRLDLIECLNKLGKTDEAYSQLRNSYVQAQGGISEEFLNKILEEIHKKNSHIPTSFPVEDSFSRIARLQNQDRYVDAAEDYKRLWPKLDASLSQSRLLDAADTFFKARYYKDSAERYAELVQATTDPSLKNDYMEKLASAYARSNQFEKAIATQKELSSQGGDSSKIAWKIAFLYYDAGECEKAVPAFDDFMQNYPNSGRSDEARWRKAWCLAQLKKYKDSLLEIESLAKAFPKKVAYWKMRWLEESGQKDLMRAAQSNLSSQGGGFYWQWDNLVRQNQSHQCPSVNPFSILSKKENPPRLNLPSNQEKTLQELLLLGLWEDFLDYYGQQNANRDLMQDSLGNWIEFFAYMEQIPPELIWAVMKEESHFNPKALSPAGAMGLMQIIPQTGYEIAQDLNLSTYATDDLLKPLINLRFGSHYLSKLNQQFSGNLIQTIAAYNAGPLAVDRWSTQRQNQNCDEFIEQIPYKETYNYVMKVMQSLWSYQGGKS